MRFLWLLVLLALVIVPLGATAQDGGEHRGPPPGVSRGEYAGPRPEADASPEERRAFWQKRAAERAQAEAGAMPAPAVPVAPAAAAPVAHDHGHDTAPSGKPAGPKEKPGPAAAKPDDANRASSRPGGMPMGMRGGNNVIWLSDSPPARGDGPPRSGMGGMGSMGGMAMGGERKGPPVKKLWLRAGTDPQKSGFARDDSDAVVETLLIAPQGKPEGEPLPPAEDGKRNLSFEMPVQGYYRLYLTTRRIQGDTLNIGVAKAEVNNVSHGATEEERSQAASAPRILESAPIELVREKNPEEKLFFQLKSGQEQAFVVLQKGLPLQGARVRFVSHQGWTKEAMSDEQGRVSFQVIRDYFPGWEDFQKRFKATYLVVAEANAAENGSFKDQPYSNVRYQATLSGAYYPSPDDYRSYAWGLGVGFAFLLFCGTAIYLYRRRRVKPFQEARFDEKH